VLSACADILALAERLPDDVVPVVGLTRYPNTRLASL
jgi:hypothetical protein